MPAQWLINCMMLFTLAGNAYYSFPVEISSMEFDQSPSTYLIGAGTGTVKILMIALLMIREPLVSLPNRDLTLLKK